MVLTSLKQLFPRTLVFLLVCQLVSGKEIISPLQQFRNMLHKPYSEKAMEMKKNGDTLHIIDCLPPDISKDDLDLGYYQSRSPLHSNIYSRPLPPKHERPAGLWQVFLYSYEVKDLCGPTKTFEYNVALYDLEPPVFLNFPQDTTLEKTEDLPPVPHNVRILDICRYVVWDTVTTTPIVNPGTNDTMAYVRQWIAEDEAGNKSFRDQMIYIRDATRPDLNSIYGYVVKEADLQNAPFPAVAGTNGIPVTLYRIDADGMSIPVKSMITGNWQGYEGRLFFTSLLPGNYLLKIDVPKGYKTVHPDSLITEIGQSDTLSLSGNSTLNLGTIHLIRDTLSKNTPLIPEKFKVKRTIKSQRPEVRLYPNPSDGRVILEQSDSQQNYDFIVFNNLGQSVKHGTVQKNSEIDLTGQKNGLYFIRLEKNHTFLDVKKILLISN